MPENDSSGFRFGALDKDPEDISIQEDHEFIEWQARKINRRFWWLLFVMILLVGGLFSAGYLDLKNRFSVQQSSGIREIENISAVFEDRLNEYQNRLDGLETTFSKEIEALDQKTVVWQKDLATLRASVEKLDPSGAVEKGQKTILQEVRRNIAPLEQKLAALEADLSAIEKKVAAQVAPLAESLAKNTAQISRLQNRIGPVSGTIVDKDTMDLELLKLRKAQSQSLAAEVAGLERRIGLLIERVQRLESRPLPSTTPPASGTQPGGIQEQPLP